LGFAVALLRAGTLNQPLSPITFVSFPHLFFNSLFSDKMILSYNKSNVVQIEEKTMTILQRQFINDTKGIPMGVILPLEEYR
jgi:hypothetical protein